MAEMNTMCHSLHKPKFINYEGLLLWSNFLSDNWYSHGLFFFFLKDDDH